MAERTSQMYLYEMLQAHEEGLLDEEQTLELFQDLVDTGLAWRLLGHYGAMAQQLIDAGLIKDTALEEGP